MNTTTAAVPAPIDSAAFQKSADMLAMQQKYEAAALALSQVEIDDIQLALDEVNRERLVRERCFPRWIGEGKISKSDARDRLSRIIKAEEILQKLLDTRSE